jgi:hypothetical protein
MPEYLSPGVYVEEVASGPRPIEGVSTSTAGFAGVTERGPVEVRLVTSWPEFTRWFGGTLPVGGSLGAGTSYTPLAVRGFFENGGQRMFFARVADTTPPPASLQVAAGANNLNLQASGPGAWGGNVLVGVLNASKHATHPEWFRLVVLYYRGGVPQPFVDPLERDELTNPDRVEPDLIEDFDDLTFEAGRSNSVEAIVRSSSRLLTITGWDDADNPARPDDLAFTALAAGDDGTVASAQYTEALARLEEIDEVSILAAPDEVNDTQIGSDLVDQCERLRDRFVLLSLRQGLAPSTIDATTQPPHDTTYGAVYYPWLRVFDPRLQEDVLVPPVGHVAGIYARTDVDRGVHKAPANEVVRGLYYGDAFGRRQPLEFRVVKRQHDLLNPRGINVIRDFRSDGRGIRVWGARTMASDPLWRYVSVRRLFLFIEESIDEGTQWVVFEPNHEPTWAAVRRSVTNFLLRVWRSGGLQGVTQDEAFFVKCDRTTMTPDDIDNGRLICLIGVAPVKPAEFVIFRISQKTVEAE